ncbi:MAG TPA: hypothetical protein VIN72_00030 [Lutibacter sp.]
MKIYIDAACDILFSSFYIKGIEEYWGKEKIFFKNTPFPNFKFNNHFLAFIIKEEKSERKIIIDYADTSNVNKIALGWSDLYCKINIDEHKNYNSNKIISIGPSFGINLYSIPKTFFLSILNYIKSYRRIDSIKRFFSNYKAQLNRPKLDDYYPGSEEHNYIYFVGSLWRKEKKTNANRANFIRACLSKNINFEGGFAPRSKNDIQGYEDLTMELRDDIKTYINKTKKSIIAFNTPAVEDCHGWKLAEFLCFGKAILTTEISRILPKKLTNKKDIFITDGSQKDIEEKLENLKNNEELRKLLKQNARKYYENELAPVKVIHKIIESNQKIKFNTPSELL